ncbi:MAG: hypothetical protein ABFD20_04885 [Anaerolineales bacterium]
MPLPSAWLGRNSHSSIVARRRWRGLGLTLVLAWGALVGCAAQPLPAPSTSETPGEALTLTLIHTNDTMGALEACG